MHCMHPETALMSRLRFFLLLLPVMFFTAANARILEIGRDKAHPDLAGAIRKAAPGDLLILYPGTYTGSDIVVDKSVRIRGLGLVILDGKGVKDIMNLKADHIHISGIHFMNSGKSSSRDYAALKITGAANCLIEHCVFTNTYFGIHVSGSNKGIIRWNRFDGKALSETGSGNGIHIWKSDSFLVEGNRVTRHRDGIYFEFVRHSMVRLNHCSHNIRYGLHYMFSDNDVYHRNQFTQNGAGVAVMYSRNVNMTANSFRDNWGPVSYGLLLKDINQSLIRDNTFYRNTAAIQLENSNKLMITHNHFLRNGWAIRMMGNCDYDSLVANNFMGNSFDISTNSSATGNLNHLVNNYWDKYEGYDLNRDHIGDVPYRPVSLFSMFVRNVPEAVLLLHSFLTRVLDMVERSLPSVIPATLADHSPSMQQIEQ